MNLQLVFLRRKAHIRTTIKYHLFAPPRTLFNRLLIFINHAWTSVLNLLTNQIFGEHVNRAFKKYSFYLRMFNKYDHVTTYIYIKGEQSESLFYSYNYSYCTHNYYYSYRQQQVYHIISDRCTSCTYKH